MYLVVWYFQTCCSVIKQAVLSFCMCFFNWPLTYFFYKWMCFAVNLWCIFAGHLWYAHSYARCSSVGMGTSGNDFKHYSKVRAISQFSYYLSCLFWHFSYLLSNIYDLARKWIKHYYVWEGFCCWSLNTFDLECFLLLITFDSSTHLQSSFIFC